MPQSLARIHVHLVFSTKARTPWIHDGVRDSLHRYMAAVLLDKGCPATIVNSVEDHVHVLHLLGRTVALSELVVTLKASSSRWLKAQGPEFAPFTWQGGYGAFAVSESNVDAVTAYIAAQREHHRSLTFQSEFQALLERHGVEYDERYLWD